jgi:hypothetical protein
MVIKKTKPAKVRRSAKSQKTSTTKPRRKSSKVKKTMKAKAVDTGPAKALTPDQTPTGGRTASLFTAKTAKKDEFYTQWIDIEREINAYLEYDPHVFKDKVVLLPCDDPEWSNFTRYFALHFTDLGIKKLISTSFAANSKPLETPYELTLFEQKAPQFDASRTRQNGKKFVLEAKDVNNDGVVNIEDLQWEYLDGDGDFRSNEVTNLRDEADIVVTNPPFSLFREFVAWLVEGEVDFIIIGRTTAITYKDIFPLIKDNRVWLGTSRPKEFDDKNPGAKSPTKVFGNIKWLTNIQHGRRLNPLGLMTLEDNKRFSKHKEVRGIGYRKYDNYDAIEVPFVDAIPSDYSGVMGVPISFLDRHNPEQFVLLGATQRGCHDLVPDTKKYDTYWEVRPGGKKTGSSGRKTNENANLEGNDGKRNYFVNKDGHVVQSVFQRVFIRSKFSP